MTKIKMAILLNDSIPIWFALIRSNEGLKLESQF